MKQSTLKLIKAALIAAVCCSPIFADDAVHWNEICRVANGRELSITKSNGENVYGSCLSISADAIEIRTNHKNDIVKVARASLAKIELRRSKGRHLASLGRGVRTGLRDGFHWLLAPEAPLALVTIPGTIAWGAVAAPFCALGDLFYLFEGKEEIKVQ